MLLNDNDFVLIPIPLQFVSKGPIDNNPALVQIINRRNAIMGKIIAKFTDA